MGANLRVFPPGMVSCGKDSLLLLSLPAYSLIRSQPMVAMFVVVKRGTSKPVVDWIVQHVSSAVLP